MDYSILFCQTLTGLGFDLHSQYTCFDTGYHPDTGWPLKLPDIEFGANTLLLLHFQDFVTSTDQGIVELQKVEQHYGSRANQVLVTYWSHGLDQYYQGPLNLIEFSSHNLQTVTQIGAMATQWLPTIDQKTKQWQCLNGRMCQHRRRAVDILSSWPNGVLSYGTEIALPQWAYDSYRGVENEENFMRLLPVYSQCQVNIVTETQYDQAPGIVTEKTIMAMLAGQIPIVIGHPGIVQDCRELGFDMFDDVVDTSYDNLPNDCRVEQAILRNSDLIQGRKDLTPYQSRLQRQRTWLIEQWPQIMAQRFQSDCAKLASHWSVLP